MNNIKPIYIYNLLLFFAIFPLMCAIFKNFYAEKPHLNPIHVPKQNKQISKVFYLQKQKWIFEHSQILLT